MVSDVGVTSPQPLGFHPSDQELRDYAVREGQDVVVLVEVGCLLKGRTMPARNRITDLLVFGVRNWFRTMYQHFVASRHFLIGRIAQA